MDWASTAGDESASDASDGVTMKIRNPENSHVVPPSVDVQCGAFSVCGGGMAVWFSLTNNDERGEIKFCSWSCEL